MNFPLILQEVLFNLGTRNPTSEFFYSFKMNRVPTRSYSNFVGLGKIKVASDKFLEGIRGITNDWQFSPEVHRSFYLLAPNFLDNQLVQRRKFGARTLDFVRL